jgi:formylglycine-generating enzyme required for sulfatase activity
MGTDNSKSDEGPAHKVYLDAFYIDVYEVTNAQYAECVTASACAAPRNTWSQTRIKYYDDPEFANYPVIYVLWHQAREYCQWRGGDLPTEAQWEKAARGGLEEKVYFWGDTLEGTEANFCDVNCTQMSSEKAYDDGFPDTAPVGSFAPNGFGLYDMAGNVWDFVLDWYSPNYYENSPYENPTGPESGIRKVARGGSWWYGTPALRVTYRETGEPDLIYSDAGIRCVYSP